MVQMVVGLVKIFSQHWLEFWIHTTAKQSNFGLNIQVSLLYCNNLELKVQLTENSCNFETDNKFLQPLVPMDHIC